MMTAAVSPYRALILRPRRAEDFVSLYVLFMYIHICVCMYV